MATSGAGTRPLFAVPRILAGDAGAAVAAADEIGQALLDRGLGPDRPPLLLSGNGVGHLLLTQAWPFLTDERPVIYSRLLSAVPVRSAVPVLAELDADEITDKGYVNQRRVLACRAALAEMLHADPVPDGVVVAGTAA